MQSAGSNERYAFAHASLLHFGASASRDPVVVFGAAAFGVGPIGAAMFGAWTVLGLPGSAVFRAAGGTFCGLFVAGADCNVSGCVVSRAGIAGAADASGFGNAGALAAEGVGRAGGTGRAGGVACCTCCSEAGPPYFMPTYPASAALAAKIKTISARERTFTVLLIDWSRSRLRAANAKLWHFRKSPPRGKEPMSRSAKT